MKHIFFSLIVFFALCAPAAATPHKPFATDGCSMWPDGTWGVCCVEHDMDYWYGGTAKARKQSDQRLKQCLIDLDHPVMARVMYMGVRIGGMPYFPLPWRWGYGLPYRPYNTYKEQAAFND